MTTDAPTLWQFNDRLLPYSRFDLQWYLPEDVLTKVDRMSMAHSLEARSPLLDYRVVELAARMPAGGKIEGRKTKAILKEAARQDLPPEVLEPRKRGFSIPLARWLREELRGPLLDVVRDTELLSRVSSTWARCTAWRVNIYKGIRDRHSQLWPVIFCTVVANEWPISSHATIAPTCLKKAHLQGMWSAFAFARDVPFEPGDDCLVS